VKLHWVGLMAVISWWILMGVVRTEFQQHLVHRADAASMLPLEVRFMLQFKVALKRPGLSTSGQQGPISSTSSFV
jgi:dolichyl-phosphate-mannose--protein O-mannosyl transferase